MFTERVQARRVVRGPEPEADAVEAGSFPGPGEGGEHKVSPAGSRDSGLQRRQDTHGESRPTKSSIGEVGNEGVNHTYKDIYGSGNI